MGALPQYEFKTGEDKFHNLISQAPVLIATFKGPSFIIATVNKMALEIWGKSYEEVINKPLFELSPELEDGLKTILNDIYTTGVPFISNEIPFQLKRIGKTDIAYFNLVYQPLRDLDNKIYGIILIGTEISEAVNARKQFEASELLNRSMLESSQDCLKILDLEGRIQFMNFNGLCQMEIDDFSTFKNSIWSTLWNSETQGLVKASIDKALKGETSRFTAFCPTAKGTPKWWEVSVSPLCQPGEPIQQILSISKDITEQKKSQEAIEKLASHLQLATDSANVGTWSLNIQTEELEWSALHKKMWGYYGDRTDLTYEDWHKLIVPEDKELAFKRVEEARVNHSFYDLEYRINKADDNTIRFIRSSGRYYYNHKGEAETLTGISIDITEEKKAEEKIKASENQFRTFADSIQNLAWIANADGWRYWYNQRWYEYTGTSLEDMEGGRWEKVHHPDYIEKIREFLKEAWKIGKAWELTIPLRRHDGKYRWFLTRAYPVKDANGNIERWIGTNTDIHEQKTNAEEKFLVEFAEGFSHYKTGYEFFNSLVTYIANKTNIDYVFIGELTEKEKNYFTIKTIALANRGKLVPSIEYPLSDGPCEQVIRGTVYNYPNHCRQTFPKNQTLVQFNVDGYVGYPLFDTTGKAIGLVAVMHEKEILNSEYVSALLKIVAKRAEYEMERNKITHQLHIQNETLDKINQTLDLNNTALENANAELKSFSYIASHDLQEPLRMIKAFSQRIVDAEKFSDKTQNYFNFIMEASERMRNLIVSLIDLSCIDKTELNFAPCNLNTIIEESKRDLYISIAEKQAIVEYENLPTINGMHIQLSQIFTNIIGNAIKYSQAEIIPHIKITAARINGQKTGHPAANKQLEYYAIKIADNGIGFEEEYASKIFEAFQRLHGRNEYSGTGIGLSIVKKIVTNHNGFIVAEGKPGIGSTFTIYIPTS